MAQPDLLGKSGARGDALVLRPATALQHPRARGLGARPGRRSARGAEPARVVGRRTVGRRVFLFGAETDQNVELQGVFDYRV